MFFGQHLKPGCKLSVKDACQKQGDVLVLTSVCLSGDGDGPGATLMVHKPDGQKLAAARLTSNRRFARLDLQLDAATSGFFLEATGAGIDLVGFTEPDEAEPTGAAPATAQIVKPASPKVTAAVPPAVKQVAQAAKLAPLAPKPASPKVAAAAPPVSAAKTNGDSAPAPNQVKDFIAAKTFSGAKAGMVFKRGKQGQGYYKDTYVAPKGLKRKADVAPEAEAPPAKQIATLKGGLKYEVVKKAPANAQIARRGRFVHVRYEGRLAMTGRRFDKGTIKFKLGAGEVIQGWDVGVDGMAVGEKRKLLIPSALAYGRSGAPPDIPPNATLAFDVELLRI